MKNAPQNIVYAQWNNCKRQNSSAQFDDLQRVLYKLNGYKKPYICTITAIIIVLQSQQEILMFQETNLRHMLS